MKKHNCKKKERERIFNAEIKKMEKRDSDLYNKLLVEGMKRRQKMCNTAMRLDRKRKVGYIA